MSWLGDSKSSSNMFQPCSTHNSSNPDEPGFQTTPIILIRSRCPGRFFCEFTHVSMLVLTTSAWVRSLERHHPTTADPEKTTTRCGRHVTQPVKTSTISIPRPGLEYMLAPHQKPRWHHPWPSQEVWSGKVWDWEPNKSQRSSHFHRRSSELKETIERLNDLAPNASTPNRKPSIYSHYFDSYLKCFASRCPTSKPSKHDRT